jgi:hypothetical protein
MVVIVFGNEIGQVNQPHWRAKPRMTSRPFKVTVADLAQPRNKRGSCLCKTLDKFSDRPLIVIRFVRLSV